MVVLHCGPSQVVLSPVGLTHCRLLPPKHLNCISKYHLDVLNGNITRIPRINRPTGVGAALAGKDSGTASPPARLTPTWDPNDQVNMVMKFGGSSVASAERMMEVADIVLSFPGTFPCVVLSAMGKTTNLLLQAGEEALKAHPGNIPSLAPLRSVN